jgi:SAM-dependent methyltransferase
MAFEDHFSRQARAYARYRPTYPEELFAVLAGLTASHGLAWDCATGSGQAAGGLAPHFARVAATDASPQQVSHAASHPKISYWVGQAGRSGLPTHSVDLITVAQAIHWFEFEDFYGEAARVLKPGGVLAAWGYGLPEITPGLDALLARFYRETLGEYWPARLGLLDEQYLGLPFPFEELPPPGLAMQANWDLAGLLGFLESWSGVQKFSAARGHDPVDEIRAELADLWGEASKSRNIRWPLFFRIGRVPPGSSPD